MRRIGRYEIVSEIGRGASGTVYLAQDPVLRRKVALKVFSLPTGLSPPQEIEKRRRFLREAQAAGGLSHPNIVTIYEVDQDPESELPFIAMEHVPGRSLQDVLDARGQLTPEQALATVAALADALHAAHEAGVVHRDIKPANVLVRDADGAVKIVDFGVARIPMSELTQSGATVGSPAYMSPEQLKGETADGRSDLFSLGVILYQALCGHRPFTGEDLPALSYSIVHGDPIPIASRGGDFPAGLDGFFERALAKDPADRFPNGAAFHRALRTVFEEHDRDRARSPAVPTTPQVASPAHRAVSRAVTSVAVLLAVAAIPLLIWGVWRRGGGFEPEAEMTPVLAQPSPAPTPEQRVAKASVAPPPDAQAKVASPEPVPVVEDAWIELSGRSTVKAGTLSLFVDGSPVYSRELVSEPRRVRRVFKKIAGKVAETFDAAIPLAPGEHEIVARLAIEGEAEPHEDRIHLTVEPGERRAVFLEAGGVIGKRLSLQYE